MSWDGFDYAGLSQLTTGIITSTAPVTAAREGDAWFAAPPAPVVVAPPTPPSRAAAGVNLIGLVVGGAAGYLLASRVGVPSVPAAAGGAALGYLLLPMGS